MHTMLRKAWGLVLMLEVTCRTLLKMTRPMPKRSRMDLMAMPSIHPLRLEQKATLEQQPNSKPWAKNANH
jgi:hypothetical protein